MKKVVAITFLLFFLAFLVYCLERKPHDFSEAECALCHRGNQPYNSREMTAPISLLCRQCHASLFDKGYMHPHDILPTAAVFIPRDMPLSSSGNITCITCHDIHARPKSLLTDRSFFLRRHERGRLFCQACHHDMGGRAGGHKAMLGEAHFQSKYIETMPDVIIDSMSHNCLTCHDGAFATSVRINAGRWRHGGMGRDFVMSSHPIGVDYEEARLEAGRKTDLRPIDDVDKRLLFFDGKVGCGTCHNPYTYEQKYLVMKDDRSRLCLSCHKLDG